MTWIKLNWQRLAALLVEHWRIIIPLVSSASAIVCRVAKPGGLEWLAAHWEMVAGAAVPLAVWCAHAYQHVIRNEQITEALPDAVNGLPAKLDLPDPIKIVVTEITNARK